MPHHTLRINDEDGNLESVQHTRFIEDASDDNNDNDPNDSINDEEEQNHHIADIIQYEDEEHEVLENILISRKREKT